MKGRESKLREKKARKGFGKTKTHFALSEREGEREARYN